MIVNFFLFPFFLDKSLAKMEKRDYNIGILRKKSGIMKKINIVLHEPEIPQNTGNIARTCAATGAALHIIRPMGFEIDDKKLKRAGLDYWDKLDITYYDSYEDFLAKNPDALEKIYYFTTKAPRAYTEVSPSPDGVFIMFGKESRGIPEEILCKNYERCVRIPMRNTIRSLNLSNSVAIAVFEILRQWDFEGLREDGELARLEWER